MESVKLHKEHQWLERLVGEWAYESQACMAPDKPPTKFTGTERVRSLGGAWILCEGQGEMPGGGIGKTIMTLGYDPAKKRFVGTFVGSMMTNLWIYQGQLDPSGQVLTLDTEGPTFTEEGKMAQYKDIIEIKSDDHRLLSSECLGDDGKWNRFNIAEYRRTK